MYKTNRQNHDFQLAYFIAGSCHTPDAAYASLCDQRDDRKLALDTAKADALRKKAMKLRAEQKMKSEDRAIALDGEADLLELHAFEELILKNVAGAEAELAFIEELLAKLQPHRKYKDMADAEAHEAAQQEEWKLELLHRAENFLLTTGTIPPDHFSTMRMHPEFQNAIVPAITAMSNLMAQPGGKEKMLSICAHKEFDFPLLLTTTSS